MPINVNPISAAASKYLSGPASEGVAGIIGSSNPYGFIAQTVLSALTAPSISVSSAGTGGQATGGYADFMGSNSVAVKKAISLKNPLHVGLLAAGLVASIYVFRKYVR